MSAIRSRSVGTAGDLYLTLGEPETAGRMAKKADTVNLDADMLGGLSSFTTTPLLIAVLVRVGDLDGARTIAEKLQKTADKDTDPFSVVLSAGAADIAWSNWATVCTLESKTECVERELDKIGSPRVNAVLCAGVVVGLVELQKKSAGK
jgi:hypothetical protein